MPRRPGHERPPPRGRAATVPADRDRRRRALGQNVLRDAAVARRLVALAEVGPRDLAVDLGAGRGDLTAPLAAAAGRVVAVERDPVWAAALRTRFADAAHVEVVSGDLLVVPLPPEPFTVVANLPFGIGTQAVRRLLADGHGLVGAVLVLQWESARRLAGTPRGGRFAATWAPWYEVELADRIPATAFRPVPAVDAGVLRLRARRPPLLTPAAFADHVALVDRVFAGGRGRTVAQRVGGSRRAVGARLRAAGIEPSATPSELAPEAWAAVTRALRAAR